MNKECNGRCIKNRVRCDEWGKCEQTKEESGKERKMGKAAEKSAGEYADNPTLMYGA